MPTAVKLRHLAYPRSKTALMQHLQTLVLRGNSWWVGGIVKPEKFERLMLKMAERYPLTRDERGRAYDRSKGLASAHLVVYPTENGICWWVLTSTGRGGLADSASLDHHVARHALAHDGHIRFEDYVMLYAHKKDARILTDARTGKEKKLLKDCSTWTWKITQEAYNGVLAVIEAEVNALSYGDDTCAAPYGLRGTLAYQRRRPLFSGVRTQVLQMHREANSLWGLVHKKWLSRYTQLAQKYGSRAGQLRPLGEITAQHLPKMMRFKVFGSGTVGQLFSSQPTSTDGVTGTTTVLAK